MAREEQQPMSDARLVTVRQRQREAAYDAKYDNDHWALSYYADVGELLDDNERLRAREAALVEVVRAVADARTFSVDEDTWALLLRNRTLSYAQTIWSKARALLASGDDKAK